MLFKSKRGKKLFTLAWSIVAMLVIMSMIVLYSAPFALS
jgi:hypothetical protein